MPEGKSIPFSAGEYKELDGLEDGTKVKFTGEGSVQMAKDGSGNIVIDSMDIESEGPATRELKNMTKQEATPEPDAGEGEDF